MMSILVNKNTKVITASFIPAKAGTQTGPVFEIEVRCL
jgi:hypothetical protein